MFFTPVNLTTELEREKAGANKLLREAKTLLSDDWRGERKMLEQARQPGGHSRYDTLLLEKNRIFDSSHIQKVCINYRLRFLDFQRHNGDLPYDAVIRMRQLEKRLQQPLKGLKIVAPAGLFDLSDKDSDPLLLLDLGNNQFYLIHQWGKDLKWYRKWLLLPFRSMKNFIITMVLAAVVFSQLVPIGSLPDVDSVGVFSIYRWYIFAFTLICFCSLSVFLLFTFRKNFSDQEWKNMYI